MFLSLECFSLFTAASQINIAKVLDIDLYCIRGGKDVSKREIVTPVQTVQMFIICSNGDVIRAIL